MGTIKTLTAIATQGNAVRQKEARLREYYLQYSDDGSNWAEYTAGGERKASLAIEKEFPSFRTQDLGRRIGERKSES